MTNISVKVKRKQSLIKGKQMPLFIQIICNRQVKRIVLDLKLSSGEWISETETIVIPPEADTGRINELLNIRQRLNEYLNRIRQVIAIQQKKEKCTAEHIIYGYQHFNNYTFWLKYILLFIEKKKNRRADTTIRNYQSSYNAFYKFCGGKDIPIKDINEKLVLKFEEYLLNKGTSRNTIAFYCRNLKTIWNMAVKEQIIEHRPSPFLRVNTKIEKTEKRAINEKYIHKLEELDVRKTPGLSLAKDLFLFCFFARGMAFIDLAHLTSKNIHGKYLIYVRRKTGQILKIELLPVMLKILKKYQRPGQHYLFPILKRENESWKEYDNALRLQNKRLKILGKQIGTHLTTYVARHSWASIAKLKGVSEDIISDCMGHTSVKTTRIYIASLDNSRLDRANRMVIIGKNRHSVYL